MYLTVQNNNMGRIVRLNISLDNSHSLDDFPVDLYSGLTSGDTTNLVYANIVSTDIPLDLMFEDSDLNVSNDPNNPFVPHCYMRISSDGCYDEIIKLEVPKVDCEMCVDFQEIIPEPTPTSIPPTPTNVSNPTPTPTPIVVSDIDVFLNNGSTPSSIYSYNPNTTVLTYLFDSTNSSYDIANTSNKLWVYDGGGSTSLLEYDITLNPFSQTFNRTITSVSSNSGLCAINDTTLINIDGSDVYELDITTNVPSATLKWSMITGRVVQGDYMYTTTNKLIVTNNGYITQYDYATGTVEVDIDISGTIPNAYGVFEYGSGIYIVDVGGEIYQIMGTSPYTLTLVDDVLFTVYGASQIPSKITEDFTPVTESTHTPTPTATDPEPTPTPTSTPTPTPSPTSGNCQEYQLWMTGQGETSSQWEWTECGGSVTTWTNVGANFRVVCSETTPVLNYGDGFSTLNGDCNNYTVTRCNDGLQVTVAKNLSCLTGTPPTYSIGDIIQFKQYSVASGNCSGESFCGTITATDSNQPYDYVVSRAATIDSCEDLTHCEQ